MGQGAESVKQGMAKCPLERGGWPGPKGSQPNSEQGSRRLGGTAAWIGEEMGQESRSQRANVRAEVCLQGRQGRGGRCVLGPQPGWGTEQVPCSAVPSSWEGRLNENTGVVEGAVKCIRGPEGGLDVVVAAVLLEGSFLLDHLGPHPLCSRELCEGGRFAHRNRSFCHLHAQRTGQLGEM